MRRSRPSAVVATPLLTSLIVAEFDIDTGACLRACYPRPPTSPPLSALSSGELRVPPGIAGHTEYFANVMLPDGAEKVNLTRTVFVVNRPKACLCTRFPVYRFRCVSVKTGHSDMRASWERHPAEDTALYIPEILFINTTTEEVSLRYKDAEIEAPSAVLAENISSMPSIPGEVLRFSKQLEAIQRNEATLATSRSASLMAGVDSSITDPGAATTNITGARGGSFTSVPEVSGGTATTGGGGSNSDGDFVFVVIDYTAPAAAVARQEGYLMKEAHFQKFLRTLTALVQREHSDATAAASVTSVVNGNSGASGAVAPESISTPLKRSSSLGSVDSPSRKTLESSPTTSFATKAHHSGPPLHLDTHDGLLAVSSGRASSASSKRQSTDGGGGADTLKVTNSLEPSGYLMLPRADSVESDMGVSATEKAGEYHIDPAFTDALPSVGLQTPCKGAPTDATQQVLFGLCAVVSRHDSTARRGGVTKSVAILGPSLVWLEPFFPILVAAAQHCCGVGGTDESALREQQRILKRCYDSVNGATEVVAAGRSKVDQLTAEISKHCSLSSGHQAYVHYSDAPFGEMIHVKIPISPASNDILLTRYSLEGLITTLGPSFLQLLLGILTEKKILILSRKGEAADVCEAAISLGIIGNLLDCSFMAQKVFPYVSVSSVDYFMGVPGYIVGTLNPIFENVSPWGWDLLCDLDKKSVVTSAERLQRKTISLSSAVGENWAAATAGLANAVGVGGGGGDSEALRSLPPPWQRLYKQLVSAIYHLRALRIGPVERNQRLRLMVEDFLYTAVVVGYVSGTNVLVPNALYPTFAHRSLVALRAEMALTSMMDNIRSHVLYPGENPAILLQCVALRNCAYGETPVHRTLQALLALVNKPYDVKLFLRRMTLAVGGLNAVGMQLTSPSAEVRAAAVALLTRVELLPEGKAAIASMNNFLLMIYERSVAGVKR